MTTFQQTISDASEPTHMAEERADGSGYLAGQAVIRANATAASRSHVGLLYTSVDIPPGSAIDSAILACTSAGSVGDVYCFIRANDVDDAANFTDEADVVSRTLTTASVTVGVDNLNSGFYTNLPAITAVIQEVIDRPGWASGNSIMVILVGRTDASVAAEIDNDSGGFNPRLTIEFTEPPPLPGGNPSQTAHKLLGVI